MGIVMEKNVDGEPALATLPISGRFSIELEIVC
jgi:hypothetical protein